MLAGFEGSLHCVLWQMSPDGHWAFVAQTIDRWLLQVLVEHDWPGTLLQRNWQTAPGLVPPAQTPGSGAPGSGKGRKSGFADGIGELLSGFVPGGVAPVKPVSSPLNAGDLSGFRYGPNVRWYGALL